MPMSNHVRLLLLAVLYRSSLWHLLAKSNANWSAGVQLVGQWLCKWGASGLPFPTLQRIPFSRITLGRTQEGGAVGALDDAYNCRSRIMASVMP